MDSRKAERLVALRENGLSNNSPCSTQVQARLSANKLPRRRKRPLTRGAAFKILHPPAPATARTPKTAAARHCLKIQIVAAARSTIWEHRSE